MNTVGGDGDVGGGGGGSGGGGSGGDVGGGGGGGGRGQCIIIKNFLLFMFRLATKSYL